MKISKKVFSLCAVLFLLTTSGAQIVSAQNKSAKSIDKSKPVEQSAESKITKLKTSPVVTQVDFIGLKNVLKKSAEAKRPLLVNFWATWCPPCREEFPELVKIDAEYRSRNLDFVTVSLDDLAEITREVPQFLAEMKATMPAYLLKTADEEAAIAAIAPGWRGGLPLTVLYNAEGKMVYSHMQAIDPKVLRTQIDKTIEKRTENSDFNTKITRSPLTPNVVSRN